MRQAATARAVLAGMAAAALLLPAIAPASAAAPGEVRVEATVDGSPIGASTEARPIRLSPRRQATLAVDVSNGTSRPIDVRIVRLEGKVVGLTFFAYDTAVGLQVAPGGTGSRRFQLDLAGLDGQATGLIPGSVKLLDADRHVVAEEGAVIDVRGSLRSVYGVFGVGVAFLTVLSFLGALVGLARHRLPANRWRRALQFLTPGLGLGLLLNFTLSATRVFVPTPSRWLTIVVVSAAVLFGLGYITPAPDTGEDDDEDDEDDGGLAALPAPPVAPELPVPPAWPELATPEGLVALPAEPVVPALPVAEPALGPGPADVSRPVPPTVATGHDQPRPAPPAVVAGHDQPAVGPGAGADESRPASPTVAAGHDQPRPAPPTVVVPPVPPGPR